MVTSLATRFCVRLLSLCSQFRGGGFEGTVEITGLLSYKPDQPWPFAADVDRIRVLPRKPEVSLRSTGRLHSVRSRRNVRCSRARCQLCCSCRGSCEDNLRGTGGACERIFFHGILFRQSGRGIAKLVRFIVIWATSGFMSRWMQIRSSSPRNSRDGRRVNRPHLVTESTSSVTGAMYD